MPVEVNKAFTVAVRYPNPAAATRSLVTGAKCSGAWERQTAASTLSRSDARHYHIHMGGQGNLGGRCDRHLRQNTVSSQETVGVCGWSSHVLSSRCVVPRSSHAMAIAKQRTSSV